MAWYLFVTLGNVPRFVMPSPVDTLNALLQPNYSWWTNISVTATEIFGGYFLALVGGVALALVFTWSKPLESFFMPLLVSLNMVPKVALGPLIIVWFKYGVFPNSIMAFSICVFPILLTTARGLREVEPELLDLVNALKGSRWQLFTKIQLPGALPYIFSGMKVAAILAVASAIVGGRSGVAAKRHCGWPAGARTCAWGCWSSVVSSGAAGSAASNAYYLARAKDRMELAHKTLALVERGAQRPDPAPAIFGQGGTQTRNP